MKRWGAATLAVLVLAVAFLVAPALAAETVLGNAAKTCLGCHAKSGIVKRFENGETINAHVDAERFRTSIHGSLNCSECHLDYAGKQHPKLRFRTVEQFKAKTAVACLRCHIPEQLKTNPVHAELDNEGKTGPHLCTNCHGSHEIRSAGGKPGSSSQERACLRCHAKSINLVFKNGESLTATVDTDGIHGSVHGKLGCADCHFGFSSDEHPKRNFRSKREYVLAAADSCRRCHFDKYTKTLDSVHYSVLSKGNLNAPSCIDCHGSHSIASLRKERTLIARRCYACHAATYQIYATSVHGKALLDERNQDTPVCIDCHRSHDIRQAHTVDYRERIPEMCGNCHADQALASKYGISADAVKTYLSDFHGVTLSFYKKQREAGDTPAKPIAVCTDCHGTHNISSMRSSNIAEVKANLVKRCRQCHANATDNFPDAWLSHYVPSPRKAPAVYLINQAYGFFMPILVIAFLFQILLHIWRYATSR